MSEKGNKNMQFISEKIVGRNLTRTRALKYVALSLLCGILFGAVAAGVFVFAERFLEIRYAKEPQETTAPATPTEAPAPVTETGTSETQTAAESSSAEEIPDETETKPLTEDDVLRVVQAELGRLDLPEEPEQEAVEPSELVRSLQDSVAVIRVTSVEQTWFERNIETYKEYAGVLISIDENEITVLAPGLPERDVSYTVTFADGTQKEAELKSFSRTDSIALLAIGTEGLGTEFLSKVRAVSFGDIRNIAVGDTVWALGSPLGKPRSFAAGLIGFIGEPEQMTDGQVDVFYADIPADAELGTYIADRNGCLIGAVLPDRSGSIGVRAVGIGWLSEVLGVLEGGEKLPFLGIKGIDVSFDMSYQGIPEGVYITDVVAGSPAYEAGLKRGDIITALGGGQIGSVEDYSSFLLRQKPGSDLKVQIQRSSGIEEYRELSLYLKTGER